MCQLHYLRIPLSYCSLIFGVMRNTVLLTVVVRELMSTASEWASGEIQNWPLALLCRKKVAEPSVRRLLDCYAKQFFH